MATWNEAKRRSNLTKHGVDFVLIDDFDWEHAVIEEDTLERYGEQRERATSWIGALLYVYVYTMRGDEEHAISLRKAGAGDARHYAREFNAAHRGRVGRD